MGPIWSYAFLYFRDTLNVSQSLMGLQLLIQCFFGETPVMFFAGWIIARLGFRNSMALAVGGTGLRLAVYAFGTNPWHMLPIEVTHGLSFGLFYTAMTLFASRVSPKGTEASVQGIMSGMFEGAGISYVLYITNNRSVNYVLTLCNVYSELYYLAMNECLK